MLKTGTLWDAFRRRLLQPLEAHLDMRAWRKHAIDYQNTVNQIGQSHLLMHYRDALGRGEPLPSLDDAAFRVYSQNGEDGILLLLLAAVGMGSRRSLELCAGNGIECNTANLILNHGWRGMLVDGASRNVAEARAFCARSRDAHLFPPVIEQAWITAENVNARVAPFLAEGDIDLLSLDMDGMDWWVWRALNHVSPRVVVAEVNVALGSERCVTAPYQPDFAWEPDGPDAVHHGASARAFVALAHAKGYRLVGCQAYGYNAFFVRDDLAKEILPEVSPAVCCNHPWARQQTARHAERIAQLEWVAVSPTGACRETA